RTILNTGDIVMSVRGTVGKLGLVTSFHEGAQISPNCLRIGLVPRLLLPAWVFLALSSPAVRSQLRFDTNQTTIETIKAGTFIRTRLPVPPLAEQWRIVNEIERRLSFIRALENETHIALTRSETLRRSLMRAAFKGCLTTSIPFPQSVLG